jgi:hypothetical protein
MIIDEAAHRNRIILNKLSFKILKFKFLGNIHPLSLPEKAGYLPLNCVKWARTVKITVFYL